MYLFNSIISTYSLLHYNCRISNWASYNALIVLEAWLIVMICTGKPLLMLFTTQQCFNNTVFFQQLPTVLYAWQINLKTKQICKGLHFVQQPSILVSWLMLEIWILKLQCECIFFPFRLFFKVYWACIYRTLGSSELASQLVHCACSYCEPCELQSG